MEAVHIIITLKKLDDLYTQQFENAAASDQFNAKPISGETMREGQVLVKQLKELKKAETGIGKIILLPEGVLVEIDNREKQKAIDAILPTIWKSGIFEDVLGMEPERGGVLGSDISGGPQFQ